MDKGTSERRDSAREIPAPESRLNAFRSELRALAFLALGGVGLICPPTMRAERVAPQGEWKHVDVVRLERTPQGCIRLWLEERTYNLDPAGEGRLIGTAGNVFRAKPVGLFSSHSSCKFPPGAPNSLAYQFRSWSLAGKAGADGNWRIWAEPGIGGGDLELRKTSAFETNLFLHEGNLVDTEGDLHDAEATVLFRRLRPYPQAARRALETAVSELHGGDCLRVMSGLLILDNMQAIEACELQERLRRFTGRYVSLRVDQDLATEFDRVRVSFPRPNPSGWRRQRGVLFSFTIKFEKQEVPHDAMVWEENGKWQLVAFW